MFHMICVCFPAAPKPDWYHTLHDGPIESLQRSPHFKDIILCVGGWTLSIWKEGVSVSPTIGEKIKTSSFSYLGETSK